MLALATLNFSQLNEKYIVESNIKEIYSILLRARNEATTTNLQRVVAFGGNQMKTGLDANGDREIDGAPYTAEFQRFTIACGSGATPPACDITNDKVVFDRRGLTNDNQTIRIRGYSAGIVPAMDCLVVSATRINIGKVSAGGSCEQR
jgi:Tfp pilus assembly protein FimT